MKTKTQLIVLLFSLFALLYSCKKESVSNDVFNALNGNWYSPDYNYSFLIQGKIGIATLSNSANYQAGDTMLKIASFDGQYYHGEQIYTDGVFHDVILKLNNSSEMYMKGGPEWLMVKQ